MSADSNSIRILAVDDHALIRQGIVGLVADQSDMSVVAESSNGREAVQQFRAHCPDITLMDLQMPEMNGLDLPGTTRLGNARAELLLGVNFPDLAHVRACVKCLLGPVAALAKDAAAVTFCKKYGFLELPNVERRLFMPMSTIEALFK